MFEWEKIPKGIIMCDSVYITFCQKYSDGGQMSNCQDFRPGVGGGTWYGYRRSRRKIIVVIESFSLLVLAMVTGIYTWDKMT